MIPVSFTCEAEHLPAEGPGGHERYRPVIRVNGDVVWRGRPVDDPAEAEQVALGYLRYAIGGMLLAPDDRPGAAAGGPEEPAPGAVPLSASLDQVVEGLRREISDSMQRLQEFIDGGEWRRFLP